MMRVQVYLTFFLPFLGVRSELNGADVWQSEDFALFPKLPIASVWSENTDCQRDSELLLEGLKNHSLWAMKMYDSSIQTPYGILYGNVFHLGQFDECMQVKQPIQSHMCLVKLRVNVSHINLTETDPYLMDPHHEDVVWKKIKDSRTDHSKMPRDDILVALCVPRSCARPELKRSLNEYLIHYFGNAGLGSKAAYSVDLPVECSNDDQEPLRADEVAFWVFSATLILISLITTVMDVYYTDDLKKGKKGRIYLNIDKESRAMRLVMSFSLKKNLKLFTKREGEPGPLDMLYGVKFVTIALIILDHRFVLLLSAPVLNYQTKEYDVRNLIKLFMPHGDLLADTFFYIGGLLSCYLLLDILKKHAVNPGIVILGRYVRLAPLYLYVVWFYASGLTKLGSGVGWNIFVGNESRFCRDNWWANVLFVNNYVNADRMCMLQSWFLACDFQFFICCVFVTLMIIKNKRVGLGILFTITIVSAIIPGVVCFLYHLKPFIIFHPEFLLNARIDVMYVNLYVKSHTRATVYFMGMISGYYLFKHRASTKKYGMGASTVGIILGLGLLFAPMVYGSQYYTPGRVFHPLESAIFASLRRNVWALGCVVLMFTHRFASIPWIGLLLSSQTMLVLNKLTYGMYLVHFIYQLSEYAKAKVSFSYIHFDMVGNGVKDIVLAMLCSLVLYLILELPLRSIFKELVFSRKKELSDDKSVKNEGYDNPAVVDVLPSEIPPQPTLKTTKL